MPRYTDKTEVTYNEFLTAAGLIAVAMQHQAATDAAIEALSAVTGESAHPDWTSAGDGLSADAVYQSTGPADPAHAARDLFAKLGVKILPPAPPVAEA